MILRRHVRQRMAERQISEDAIRWVLDHYTTRRPAPLRGQANPAEILTGEFQGRRLKVYIVHGSHPPIVKTVAWDGDDQQRRP